MKREMKTSATISQVNTVIGKMIRTTSDYEAQYNGKQHFETINPIVRETVNENEFKIGVIITSSIHKNGAILRYTSEPRFKVVSEEKLDHVNLPEDLLAQVCSKAQKLYNVNFNDRMDQHKNEFGGLPMSNIAISKMKEFLRNAPNAAVSEV